MGQCAYLSAMPFQQSELLLHTARLDSRGCGKQFTVKLGTLFEDSHIGLEKWLPVLWLIAQEERSVSFRTLARLLGTTHRTIWFMFHRIRLAMRTEAFRNSAGLKEQSDVITMRAQAE